MDMSTVAFRHNLSMKFHRTTKSGCLCRTRKLTFMDNFYNNSHNE